MLDPLVDIDTPNGRVTMPRSQADMYGLTPPMPSTPDDALASLGGMPPAQLSPPVPDASFSPPPAPPPVSAPPPSAAAAHPAAPTSDAVTGTTPPIAPVPGAHLPHDLSKATYGDVTAARQSNLDQQSAAQQRVDTAQAAGAADAAAAMQERDRQAAARIADIEAKQAADQAALAAKEKAWEAKQNEWMNAKVTRRSISTNEIIGAALAGLGQAMDKQSGPNIALQMAMTKIQKNVDDQERERDQLGKQAGALKGSLDYMREVASDRNAQRVGAMGLDLQQAGRQLETVAAKATSAVAKERVGQTAVEMKAKGLEMYGAALQQQHAEDHAKAQLAEQKRATNVSAGIAMAGQKQAAAFHADEIGMQYAQMAEARNTRVLAARTEADKEAAAREVPDAQTQTTGADGKSMVSAYRARSPESAEELTKIKAARDVIDGNLSEALRIRQSYPTMAAARNSPEWEKLNTLVSNSAAAYKQLMQLKAFDEDKMGKVLGGDPFSGSFAKDMITGLWRNDNPSAGIDEARKVVTEKYNAEANARRDPRGGAYVPLKFEPATFDKPIVTENDEKVQRLLKEQTPQEIRDNSPGVYGLDAERAMPKIEDATGRVAKGQAQEIGKYVDQLDSKDPKTVEQARKSLVTFAASDKPQLAQYAIDQLVRVGDQQALGEVKAKLAAGGKSEREIKERLQPVTISQAITTPATPLPADVPGIAVRARAGDRDAIDMLVGLSMQPGDPRARAAFDALRAMKGKGK